MILLLGGTGYIGQAFASELRRRSLKFLAVSRKETDYTRFDRLLDLVRTTRSELVINAAGYAGKPNVDACELARAETLQGNTLLPQTVAHACSAAGVPWGHVSSGCIYAGAKVEAGAGWKIEKDLTQPHVQELLRRDPQAVRGFSEQDEPNFSFRNGPCSFYSGTKALAEEAILSLGEVYLWRLRIPFDEQDHSKNYLTKVQRYSRVYDNVNSLSHRGDFVCACLDLWERRAPFGIYNVTNPGFTTAREVVALIQKHIAPNRQFEFWNSDAEFYAQAAKTPRSNCVLDVTKLLSAGVKIRSVHEALEDALENWKPASSGSC